MKHDAARDRVAELIETLPAFRDFMVNMGLPLKHTDNSITEYANSLQDACLEEVGLSRSELVDSIVAFLSHLEERCCEKATAGSLSVLRGVDKLGNPEAADLHVGVGEILCVVGPTGSGKSRLLEDIGWLAQGDTPTGRRVLIDGRNPRGESESCFSRGLVAQLSQSMNFVIDVSVRDFILMHAESRMLDNPGDLVRRVLTRANSLSGEAFYEEMPVSALSGGQSRALMIADIACLSSSPIVLIDEVENAGIDRKKALDLLVRSDKIVVIATHDPILALMGNGRVIMKNGGIARVVDRTEKEERLLREFQAMQDRLNAARDLIRDGRVIDSL